MTDETTITLAGKVLEVRFGYSPSKVDAIKRLAQARARPRCSGQSIRTFDSSLSEGHMTELTRVQYGQAIEKLKVVTSVPEDDLLDYEDYELKQWMWELGYEWDDWNQDWVESEPVDDGGTVAA